MGANAARLSRSASARRPTCSARVEADGTIVAVNCVFHKLAAKTRAVCRYDERLLSGLLGYGVRLGGCMQDGANGCTFAAATGPGTDPPAPGPPGERSRTT